MTDEPNVQPEQIDEATGAQPRLCPQCQSQMPVDAPAGLCPRCLLQLGFDSRRGDTRAPDPYRPPFVAPLPEHLAPHFPQLQIVERIGYGGMGVVYRARQRNLDRSVALKILRPDVNTDPTFAERFEREAKLLGRLNHPNIVGIHDYGKTESLYYLIMEFVDGRNLRQIQQAEQMSSATALAIVPQICAALQYAHGQGIVHRDIKPENILINTAGLVKIADFGLAKLTEIDDEWGLTGQWQVMGTPHYMAPEQIERPSEVDHRADIYSLGVVLYEMLTGELPLGRFAVPSMRAQVDVRLDEVVLRTLEKEPQLRYQRITDVQTDLENVRDTPHDTTSPAIDATEKTSHLKATKRSIGSWFVAIKQEWISKTASATTRPGMGLIAAGFLEVLFATVLLLLAPFQGRETTTFLVFAATCLVFGVIAVLTGLLQRKREFLSVALAGLIICLLPVSWGWIVRGPMAIWALFTLRKRDARAAFASPPWKRSMTYQTLAGVAEVSADTAKSTASTAQQVSNHGALMAVGFSRLQGVRKGVSGLLLAAGWTLACLGVAMLLEIGWTQIFLPQRWELTDRTAHRIDNLIELPTFSITGSGITTEPSLPQRRPLVLKQLQFASYSDPASPHRISIHLDEEVPRCFDSTFGEMVPFTREHVDEWLTAGQPFSRSNEADQEDPIAERQRSVDNLHEIVQQLHRSSRTIETERLPLAQWFERPRVAAPTIASLLDRSVFKPAQSEPVTVRQVGNDVGLVANGFVIMVWLFGIGLIVRGCLQLPLNAIENMDRDTEDRICPRLSIAQMMFHAAAFSGLLLASCRYLAGEIQLRGNLPLYVWLNDRHSQSLRAVLMITLVLAAVLAILAATGLRQRRFRRLLRWMLLPIFLVGPIGLTALLASQYPWWHDWPLLLPHWLCMVAAMFAWVQTRYTKISPASNS